MKLAGSVVIVTLLAVGCGDDGGGGGSGGAAGGGGSPSTGGAGPGGAAEGGAGGSAPCEPACTGGLTCCDGVCANTGNDINNCGMCGNPCEGPGPFCDNGTCGAAPCDGGIACDGADTCCGSECCSGTQICCVVPMGPVGPPTCVEPNENGTCEPGCPECVCASPDTPILTPTGERPIADLAVGDLVYSLDQGVVRAVPLLRVNRVRVHDHRVMRVTLEGGRVLEISPRHPTADGRFFSTLRAGDDLHGVRVERVEAIPYGHDYTHDILPDSDSGAYFAGGALIGTTLGGDPSRAAPACVEP